MLSHQSASAARREMELRFEEKVVYRLHGIMAG